MNKKRKCLYKYDNLKDISEENFKISNWKIIDDCILNRTEKIENYYFFEKLKKDSKSFLGKINKEEIVSWLDSLTILNKLRKSKELDEKIKKDIVIFQEYLIPYSNNYRADFLLCLGNKILILEFSYSKSASKYNEKLLQALRYKETLQTIIPRDYIVGQFIFTYFPEYEKDLEKIIRGNIQKNQKTLETLIKLINRFFDLESSSKMLDSLE